MDTRNKKFNKGENPERYLPERYAITITICNSYDASQSHAQEIHSRIQTY